MYNGRNSFQFIKKRFRSWEKMNKLCGLVGSADRGIASRPCSIRLGMSNRDVFQCEPCIYIDFQTFWTRDITGREREIAECQNRKREEREEGIEGGWKEEMLTEQQRMSRQWTGKKSKWSRKVMRARNVVGEIIGRNWNCRGKIRKKSIRVTENGKPNSMLSDWLLGLTLRLLM